MQKVLFHVDSGTVHKPLDTEKPERRSNASRATDRLTNREEL